MDYSERVESLLRSGHKVTAEGEAFALIELSDCSKPHLIIDVLGRNGQFKTIFEKELMVNEVLDALHLRVFLRASMYGQPVAVETSSSDGNFAKGKSLQIEKPEQVKGTI